MEEKVGYQSEESLTPVGDWRWQESVNMTPGAIMDELLGLSEEICDAKSLWEEAKAELREAQERLKLMEAQVLQAALDSKDRGVSDQVKGKNAEERKRKADIYLADHLTVKQLAFEVKPLESLEAAARVAMETLLERSKNLHQWARMFEAQVRLLSTVRVVMPEPAEIRMTSEDIIAQISALAHREFVSEEDVLAAMTAGGVEIPVEAELSLADKMRARRIILSFAELLESQIHGSAAHSVWVAAQGWVAWYANPVGPPPVGMAELEERIVKVQARYIGEEPEPDGARWKAIAEREIAKFDPVTPSQARELNEPHKEALVQAVDELFPPDVEIPPSMDVAEEEVDAVKAAVERYQDIGEKADGSPGPSL